jgi:hypothetical protein
MRSPDHDTFDDRIMDTIFHYGLSAVLSRVAYACAQLAEESDAHGDDDDGARYQAALDYLDGVTLAAVPVLRADAAMTVGERGVW